jgi:hypothetical protein
MKLECANCHLVADFTPIISPDKTVRLEQLNCPKCGHTKFNGPVEGPSPPDHPLNKRIVKTESTLPESIEVWRHPWGTVPNWSYELRLIKCEICGAPTGYFEATAEDDGGAWGRIVCLKHNEEEIKAWLLEHGK